MHTFLLTFAAIVSTAFAAVPPDGKAIPSGGKATPPDPLHDKGRPVATTPSMTPEETAKAFKLPPGFKVQVVTGEPDLVQPIAYAQDDRGRLWVVTNTNYPVCPGEKKDSILIFESTRGDGRADKRTVFYDKLTFASGIAIGHGGVWVGAPPNLLFFPRKNDEDKFVGEPEVVLDGWGNEDTHETLNDFTWGPDGWLYGTHGVFTFSNVGKPGTPKAERTVINAAVWRYHPVKKIFERWAEGGSNQWGLDWNDHGEAFFAACVIPHMWHGIQGARYARQGGQHADPNTYDDIKTIAWGRYEKAGYCGMMVYLGGLFPPEWRDTLFFHDIHMNKQRNERVVRVGSGYKSERNVDFMDSGDKWFRGLSPQYGPDGSVFVNDWYDKVPCHQQREFTDRTNGRIYKVTMDSVKPVSVDLSKATEAELVQYQ
ncbi:MAG: PVC-type heme-binding CxxCH protein, partial [Chthoniobacteraceae bacterium]